MDIVRIEDKVSFCLVKPKEISIVFSLAVMASLFGSSVARAGESYNVRATREGLVGYTTATGHKIRPDDMFVALPSRKALGKRIEVCKDNICVETIVKDVGPWNTKDDYWNKKTRPQAESGIDLFGRKTNRAGIDLADGISKRLNCGDMCRVTWRFLE